MTVGAKHAEQPGAGLDWYSPAFSPRTGLFYVTVWENSGAVITPVNQDLRVGEYWMSGVVTPPVAGAPRLGLMAGPINVASEATGQGAVVALDPATGRKRWRLSSSVPSTSGVLATVSDLLFAGSGEGYFHALDARSGAVLWKTSVGAAVHAAPVTYAVDGRQYVTVAAGNALFTYGLRD